MRGDTLDFLKNEARGIEHDKDSTLEIQMLCKCAIELDQNFMVKTSCNGGCIGAYLGTA